MSTNKTAGLWEHTAKKLSFEIILKNLVKNGKSKGVFEDEDNG